jgi:hypothetical protein
LLPDPVSLALCNIEKGEEGWVVEAAARNAAACPDCQNHAESRPLAVPKQQLCQKIFTERVPAVAAPHCQRTERLESIVQVVGRSLGGRPAERLMRRLGMAVSNDTTLRRVKRGAQIACDKKLRVVGVDDWARKKGQNYGTILVDLERRTVADLLPERSAQQVEHWFKQHPGVEIVSRGRFGLYAKAAQRGAPQAQQVADRFHLLVNLQEAVEHELSRQRRLLFYVDPSRSERTPNAPLPTRLPPPPNAERTAQYQDVVSARVALQQAQFEKVHGLRYTGMNASQIVRETGISRKRVDKWLRLAAASRTAGTQQDGTEDELASFLSRLPGAEMGRRVATM